MTLFQRIVQLVCLVGLSCAAQAQTCNANIAETTPTTDFVDNGDGTVTHSRTGLMWKRCAEGQTWSGGTCSGSASTATWANALKAAVGVSTAGHSDWRLPNLNELESLVEEQCFSPSLNSSVFPNAAASDFWSASAVAGSSRYAWFVDFYSGNAYSNVKSNAYQVRLVRAGQSFASFDADKSVPPLCTLTASASTVFSAAPSLLTANCTHSPTSYTWTGGTCAGTTAATCAVTPSATTTYTVAGVNAGGTSAAVSTTVTVTYSDNGDGTVTDPGTGLTWMRCSMGQTWDGVTCTGTEGGYTWDQANALTGTITFAGKNDWRLPNVRELATIVDQSKSFPAIDSIAFPATHLTSQYFGVISQYYWPDSRYVKDSRFVWAWNFALGGLAFQFPTANHSVRLVRGGQAFGSLLSITRPNSDYVDHGDGTVTHIPTLLMWKRCSEGQVWSGTTCTGTASNMSQADVTALKAGLAGRTDWRVPTVDEVISLVDYSAFTPAINTAIFPATPRIAYFWSTGNKLVNFDSGFVSGTNVDNVYHQISARLVRSVQITTPLCSLTANPSSVAYGGSTTLTANCTPVTSYSWTGGSCAGTTAATCTVTPSVTTTYTVAGVNTGGAGVAASATVTVTSTSTLITRYRLYHDGTKEHLYTTDANEYSVLATRGWLQEGAIYQLYQGAGSLNGVAAVPFYRLYNRISQQHHWTTDANEYNVLGQGDWTREGVDGYILPSTAAGSIPVYRLYLNAFGGLHLWTTDLNEKTVLSTRGWVYEGVSGYVVPLQ